MTKILRWLKSLFHRPHPSALRYGVTIKDFKADPARIKAMSVIYRSPIFQHAMSVVASSAPPYDKAPKDAIDAAHQLGVAGGVRATFAMFKFLGEKDEVYEEVKTTWGVSDDDEAPESHTP
jgi:hypothetical protein